MKSDIFKIIVTACPDKGVGEIDGEQMLALFRELERLYPDAEITVGITTGNGLISVEDGDDKDHRQLLKISEEHGNWY